MLRAQIRTLEGDRHKLTIELRQRQQQVEALKARFDAAQVAAGETEGHSQAYYIIKAAQAKEALQREGDELNDKIRVSERELRALQSTLHHLNARNAAYRESFQKADGSSEEAEQLRELEEKAKLAKDAVFRKRKELQRLTTDAEEDKRRLDEVTGQIARLEQQRSHLQQVSFVFSFCRLRGG